MGVPGNANALLLRSAAAAGGYQVSRSLRFNSSDSAFCSRSVSSAGSRTTWTWAGWVKKCRNGAYQSLFTSSRSGFETLLLFDNSDRLYLYNFVSGSFAGRKLSTSVFRDPSAWYHVVAVWDSTNATAADRCRLYVNGVRLTAFDTSTDPGPSEQTQLNDAYDHQIGNYVFGGSSYYLNGYLADIHFIDGQALTPSSFTEVSATTGQLIPKAYTGSYGTNGFKLTFSDNSGTTSTTLGKDAAGSNNWTPNNFSVASGSGNDSLVDTPTSYGTDTGAGGEVRGNYATLNPLDNNSQTLANGNLDVTGSLDAGSVNGTIAVSSGKYYWEVTASASGGDIVGIWSTSSRATNYPGATADSYGYNQFNGQKYNNGSASAYGATFSSGDVIGVALDMDAGTLVFYKNGVSQGTAFSSLTGSFRPSVRAGYTSNPSAGTFGNFGQRPFAYTAPSGFKALCDTNLPAPVVAKSSDYFQTVLYTGNSSTQTITGLDFNPDLIWSKSRSGTFGHGLFDSVRGVSRALASHSTNAEGVGAAGTGVTAFNSNGFSLGPDDAAFTGYINYTGSSQVAWCWDAGSSTVTNTQGSITSSVRANASAGFSVITATTTNTSSQTFGHGLGVAPVFHIIKLRNGTDDWYVYHSSVGATQYLKLNATTAATTSSALYANTAPTSSVITLGSGWNSTSYNIVCYAFAPVVGYSSFGSYTGNGSTDGPFVYTGFRPRWVMIKSSSVAGESWFLLDTSRSPYNVSQEYLVPNSSAAETSAYTIMDLLSNGFKLKTSLAGSAFNGSGATYIYAAFAESPFQFSRAR